MITTVFDGELRSGMVMVYGTRVRHHVSKAVEAVRAPGPSELRDQLVELLLEADDPVRYLSELAATVGVPPRALSCPEELDPKRLQRALRS